MSQEPEATQTRNHEELIVTTMTLGTGGFQIPNFDPAHAVTLDVNVIGEGVPANQTRTMKLFLELTAAAELAEILPGYIAAAQEQAKQIQPPTGD